MGRLRVPKIVNREYESEEEKKSIEHMVASLYHCLLQVLGSDTSGFLVSLFKQEKVLGSLVHWAKMHPEFKGVLVQAFEHSNPPPLEGLSKFVASEVYEDHNRNALVRVIRDFRDTKAAPEAAKFLVACFNMQKNVKRLGGHVFPVVSDMEMADLCTDLIDMLMDGSSKRDESNRIQGILALLRKIFPITFGLESIDQPRRTILVPFFDDEKLPVILKRCISLGMQDDACTSYFASDLAINLVRVLHEKQHHEVIEKNLDDITALCQHLLGKKQVTAQKQIGIKIFRIIKRTETLLRSLIKATKDMYCIKLWLQCGSCCQHC
eukprot:jgi/Botrbrau1/216/Bobra.0022s0195.1